MNIFPAMCFVLLASMRKPSGSFKLSLLMALVRASIFGGGCRSFREESAPEPNCRPEIRRRSQDVPRNDVGTVGTGVRAFELPYGGYGAACPSFPNAVISPQDLACCRFSLFCTKGASLPHTSNLLSLGSGSFNILLNSFFSCRWTDSSLHPLRSFHIPWAYLGARMRKRWRGGRLVSKLQRKHLPMLQGSKTTF